MNVEIIYWKDDLALVKMSKGYHIEKVSNVYGSCRKLTDDYALELHSGARFECRLNYFPSFIVMQMLFEIF